MMAYTYQMLAIIYSYNNENIKSESIYKKLIALAKKEQMYDILEDSYNNLLWLYYRKKDTQNFINCLQALKKEKGINIDAQTLVVILLFCYYHSLDDEFDFWKSSFHKNMHDKELFNKMAEAAIYAKSNNFDAAIANLQDCLKLADSYENEEITLIIELLFDIYSQMKNKKKMMECLKLLHELNSNNSFSLR